jgi:hypothetical protein
MRVAHILDNPNEYRFVDIPVDFADSPRHAMVLIGARKTASNEYFFLLQDWWKSRYFVEVSGEYLALCEARIIFYTGSRLERREDCEDLLYEGTYAESCLDAIETCYDQI